MKRSRTDVLAGLPPEPPGSRLADIADDIKSSRRMIVVLDDDPTGTQTVHDTPVLTQWSKDALTAEFAAEHNLFYILTNSRALPVDEADERAREIGRNLRQAAAESGRPLTVISRSDSTLRGHYPHEVLALEEALGRSGGVHVLVPFFHEGGRLTVDEVHYVADGDDLIPAAETPFAQDPAFGFRSSNLIDWAVEKHAGRLAREQVHSISINALRESDSETLAATLAAIPAGCVCIVNAAVPADLEAFVVAARLAERRGATFMYRTAASFVQVCAGLNPRPLLTSADLSDAPRAPGLVVVGSHVPKTTRQLERLLQRERSIQAVALDVGRLLSDRRDEHIRWTLSAITSCLRSGRDVALHTSRDLISGDSASDCLRIGSEVSSALCAIVSQIDQPLRFLIAKGGITSSDLATNALSVRRATVTGQIIPGVPVWRLGPESTRADLTYVVFPGNVGDDDALRQAYRKLA